MLAGYKSIHHRESTTTIYGRDVSVVKRRCSARGKDVSVGGPHLGDSTFHMAQAEEPHYSATHRHLTLRFFTYNLQKGDRVARCFSKMAGMHSLDPTFMRKGT